MAPPGFDPAILTTVLDKSLAGSNSKNTNRCLYKEAPDGYRRCPHPDPARADADSEPGTLGTGIRGVPDAVGRVHRPAPGHGPGQVRQRADQLGGISGPVGRPPAAVQR